MSLTIGNLTIGSSITHYDAFGSASSITDIMATKNKIYVVSGSLNYVRAVEVTSSGLAVTKNYSAINWYEQDNTINEVCRSNSSVPGAFTAYTKDGKDYLFGWSLDKYKGYTWEIDSQGNISKDRRTEFELPVRCGSHSRAGWNGKDKIFVSNYSGGSVYGMNRTAWIIDIPTKVATLVTNGMRDLRNNSFMQYFGSSYTGNGVLIDGNFIYFGDGANESNGVLACWDITNRRTVDVIKHDTLISKCGGSMISSSNSGNLTISPLYNIAYLFRSGSAKVNVYPVSGIQGKNIKRSITVQESKNITERNASFIIPSTVKELMINGNETICIYSQPTTEVGGGTVPSNYEIKSNLIKPYVNNLPSTPTSISVPSGAVRVGQTVQLSWSVSTDSDGDKVQYEISFYNGTTWKLINNFSVTTAPIIIPATEDTSQAKFRVRAYDGKDYSDFKESSVFSVYNNTIPSNPSAFLTPTSGQVVKPLQTIKVNWGNSIDEDEDDELTYTLEFFDGKDWSVIGLNLSKTTFNHMIPKIRGIKNAKYRVKAWDTMDYSGYTESNEFEVLDVDLSVLSTPNALALDGKDDKIPLGENTALSFSKALTIGFNKIKLSKSNSPYPLITRMYGEGKPSYSLYVTPEGHLKLSYGHESNPNDSVELEKDCTGKWITIEAYIDTENGRMGISCDCDEYLGVYKDIPKGESIIEAKGASTDIGYDFTTQKFGEFQVSGVALFNKNLSKEEKEVFRNGELKGNEEGLVGCYPLNDGGIGASIKDISPTKNDAPLIGGIQWAFQFSVATDIKTPYPYLPQTVENLEYLRYKIDEFRHSNGLTLVKWTDSIIREDVTPIKAVHWNEARKAIVEVYDKMGQKFANKSTEEELKDTIQPHSTKYEIRNLPNVINSIISGLMNK